MREAIRRNGDATTTDQDNSLKQKKRPATYCCSICTSRIWFNRTQLMEPEGVPQPRLSWTLCKSCYQAVLDEMQHSPIHSPLRLRIAMGMVASERWPHAYPTRISSYVSDRRWIIFLGGGFFLAMIFHLALIVVIASLK